MLTYWVNHLNSELYLAWRTKLHINQRKARLAHPDGCVEVPISEQAITVQKTLYDYESMQEALNCGEFGTLCLPPLARIKPSEMRATVVADVPGPTPINAVVEELFRRIEMRHQTCDLHFETEIPRGEIKPSVLCLERWQIIATVRTYGLRRTGVIPEPV